MTDNAETLRNALENARISYHQGNHSKTRYWARLAASINPNIEEPWLWLAAVSSPRASIAYLEKALSINPHSQRARLGMHWAIKRVRIQPIRQAQIVIPTNQPAVPARLPARRKPAAKKHINYRWLAISLVLLVVITTALVSPAMGFYFNALFSNPEISMASQNGLVKGLQHSYPNQYTYNYTFTYTDGDPNPNTNGYSNLHTHRNTNLHIYSLSYRYTLSHR